MIEILFKIGVTLVIGAFIYYQLVFLKGLWKSQIDPKATVARFLEKLSPETDSIVKRDPMKIYQTGKSVGNVSGNVEMTNGKYLFHELSETAELNPNLPFEWKRQTFRIVSIESSVANLMSEGPMKHAVLRKVACEEVSQ